ncbi:MAG: glycoside hydrolase family 125 protein [Holophagaceae bacterium]|nr:glycoside hydrolase family 125 protein [Holophagaceae bacterium]
MLLVMRFSFLALTTAVLLNAQTGRPELAKRNFTSSAVEQKIVEIKSASNPVIARLFENCFPNTLDTTVTYKEKDGLPDTFVITGDINAMWLRDSTAQVWPYLSLVNSDPKLKTMLAGLVRRQTDCIIIDPYANAFNDGPGTSHWASDHTKMLPELHERKWEIDSLCWPIRLAHGYYKATNDGSVFDEKWKSAMRLVIQTFKEQQRKGDRRGPHPYRFSRTTAWQHDTMAQGGLGNPWKPCGLIASAFRPSDDATLFLFLVPSNHFAVVSLRQMAELAEDPAKDPDLASVARELATEVEIALHKHAIVTHPTYGQMWAYEVDGYGNALMMDDANLPSLVSLPYLGACKPNDKLYLATRRFVLSADNPYFAEGKIARGISSPHADAHRIWHLALIAQGITSTDKAEVAQVLQTLSTTHADTYFMHEAFDKDDPKDFTRKWFAWANTFFGEFILHVYENWPELLK